MNYFSYLFVLLIYCSATAQKEHLEYALIDDTDPTGWIYTSPKAEPGVRGRQYLFMEWKLANLTLSNDDVKSSIYSNYNLESQTLEISTQYGIKLIPAGLVKEFNFKEVEGARRFTYTPNIEGDCRESHGNYFEVFYEGPSRSLVQSYELVKKDPIYNEKLGIGDNNVRLILEDHLYLITEKTCAEIKGSAGRRAQQLGKILRNSRIETLAKKNNLKIKDPRDLALLLKHLE